MKSWEMFKKTTPMYLCLSKNSTFISNKDIHISKSGANHYSCNFAIIENSNPVEQQDIIKKYFDCDGLIFSTEKNKNSIDSWIKSSNFKYLGKFPLMHKQHSNFSITTKENPNIVIKRVASAETFKDFFVVFTKIRKISLEESLKMFSKKIFDPEYFLYVAYYNNIPAGISVLIKVDNSLMAVDVDVLKEFRESNILKMFAEKALSEAEENKIYNYGGLPTSPFVYKLGLDLGYVVEGYCYIWQKGIKEAA